MFFKNLISVPFLLIAACSSKPVKLELDKTYSKRLDTEFISSISCPISLVVIDERKNKKTYAKIIDSETLMNWVQLAFQESIERPQLSDDTQSRLIDVEIRVRQAYVHHLSTSHSAILAIDLNIDRSQYYIRGQDTDVLWWGATSEYTTNMNGALDKVMFDISEIISLRCQDKPI